MSAAAHPSVVRGVGDSTAFTNEPTTALVAGFSYQLDTDARRLLDPAVAVTVEVDDGGGFDPVTTGFTIDYLFGVVTFDADQGSNDVRVSGSYLPAIDLLGVTSWNISQTRDVLDDTTVNAGDQRTKKLGLKDLTGSIEVNEALTVENDLDGELILQEYLDSGAPLLLEVQPAPGAKRFRAWVLLETSDGGGAVDGLINNTVNYTGAARLEGAAGWGWEP